MKINTKKWWFVLRDILRQRKAWLAVLIIAVVMLAPINHDALSLWQFLALLSIAGLAAHWLLVITFTEFHIKAKEDREKQ